jgi:hypothetical protein
MASEWSDFAARHWPIMGGAVSLIWFYAGRQSFSKGKLDSAMVWQCVAVIIILIVCGGAFVEMQWISGVLGLGVLYIEVRSIRIELATREREEKGA